MVVCGILPLLLLMVLFFKLPESVRFLIKHNQLIAAQKILEKIQGSVIDLTRLANVIDTTSSQSIRPVQFLFRRPFFQLAEQLGLRLLAGIWIR